MIGWNAAAWGLLRVDIYWKETHVYTSVGFHNLHIADMLSLEIYHVLNVDLIFVYIL